MRKVKIITADEAAKLVKNGDTITTSGFVASAIPEALNKAVEKKIPGNRRTQQPDICILRFSG